MAATPLTQIEFEQAVAQSPVPVMIDFWGDKCGPCQMLSPVIDRIAELAGDHVRVYKVHVNSEPELAADWGVRGVPTVIIFEGGEEKTRLVGARHPQEYLEALGMELA